MSRNLVTDYEKRFETVLNPIANLLREHLIDILRDIDRVDVVVTRAKSPARFVDKALKQNEDGTPKYENPLVQIQDQIGARINVLYLSDIRKVKTAVEKYMHSIERSEKRPDSDAEFGYFGEHFVFKLPDDVIPEGIEEDAPEFFELQIKTLFQHAWSEANHDIGYKAPRELTSLERRQMAFSAAQAWGADQIFAALAQDLTASNDDN